ncbi:hypothetical protein CONCODRAFT_168065 [Conidiobolus coronatus NRRL 28638]|uniref:RNI-like protein n=1 Tax=Conidiobolus coronatus (strain ATCC 28846 / CBS 209.66 / NRRL 28638) TaxID=796925 RepID=A0A137NVG0_CONC2|nr:hypothetical protein CONCODRAFT_168065 [Conidiobolus coronatus NRRL 28638]|eukprot:KXN66815.1 hypothetical protein CONCODRAFT_168065 [Conidiobolus coronatus NRRL 28638]
MKNNKSKINWLNVIFNLEFQSSLDKNTLINVSILSKLVRNKLRPLLFKNIQLSTKKFNNEFKDNIFIKYFNCLADPDLYDNISKEVENCSAESGLDDFALGLNSIKDIARALYVADLNRAGYYMFCMVNSMNNLTVLKLKYSTVPYSSLAKLGESLPNLKDIKLISLILAKLPAENIQLDYFVLPPKLSVLEVYDCRIITTTLLLDPHEFLFNEFTRAPRNGFTLPNISVPLLKKLAFFPYTSQEADIKEFLEINTNLESLRTELFHSNLVNTLTSLKSLEIITLSNLDNINNISVLKLLKRLKIYNVSTNSYENIKKLCLICPNLEYLHFNMSFNEYFQPLIDSFLFPILTNLCQLKTLQLHLITNDEESLNIEKLDNIESIIIETKSITILNLSFEGCKNLKRVIFKAYIGEINTQDFKDKFNNYKNWIFKFNEDTITGHEIK